MQKSRKIDAKIPKGREKGHLWGVLFKGCAPDFCSYNQRVTRKRGVGHTFLLKKYGTTKDSILFRISAVTSTSHVLTN
jgi:hypothetical protein